LTSRDATVHTRPLAGSGVAAARAMVPGTSASPQPAQPDAKPGASAPATPSGQPSSAPRSSPAAPPSSAPPASAAADNGLGSYGPAKSARHTGTQSVALTFDDGPDPVNTPKILDLLKAQGIKATFCVVGFRARDHPDLIKRIADEGHTFCNHSWQHLLDLAKRPADYVNWDLTQTNAAIHAAAPDAQIKYFRAPGGNFTADLVAKAQALGMASIYWEVDPRDWEHKSGEGDAAHITRVVHSVQHDTRPGSIVLSHDNGQPDTIVAYQTLIPWLKDRFALVPLPV
jgi:peptidoglycan/xylan/chitin deacetylase (PgdA/CDA1 family)